MSSANKYKQGLFHDWTPKLVQLLLIIVCLLPLLAASGVYSVNTSDMTSDLGVLSEWFSFANYASFIGMTIAMPMVFRTKQYFPSKVLAVGSFIMIAVLSGMCASTKNEYFIVSASFFLGMFKFIGLMEFIVPVYYIISPEFNKQKFYPIFYPFTLIIGVGSGYFFSSMSTFMYWEYANLFMIIYALICAFLLVIFMHNSRAMKKVPLYQISWPSIFIYTLMMMSLNYILVFGKYHGWFQSDLIIYCSLIFVITLVMFITMQLSLKRPFIGLSVFKNKNVYSSLIMIALFGMYQATASIQSMFMMGVLKYSSFTNITLNMAMLPGVVIGAFISAFWFKKDLGYKGLILIGFGAYLLAQYYFYFLFSPTVEMYHFIVPNMMRGIGFCILYIAIAAYGSDGLYPMDSLNVFAGLIAVRSFIGPALFGAVLSWVMYLLQVQTSVDLASYVDAADSFAMARGGGMGIYGAIQIQAILVAGKQLFGYTIVSGIIFMIYIATHRFTPIEHRRLVIRSKRLKGESTKGYRGRAWEKIEEQAMTEAAQFID